MTAGVSDPPNFTQLEEKVRRYWQRSAVDLECSSAGGSEPPYSVQSQPASVAGPPWTDQVRILSLADLFVRYHRMRGQTVDWRSGWSCHGLPLEIAVEMSLDPSQTGYDLDQFNAACRQAAMEGREQAELWAKRIGVWLDEDSIHSTMETGSMGTVWGALHRLWDAGRLRSEQTVVPFCPRCGTHLSGHDSNRLHAETDTSQIWLGLPWLDEEDAYLLAWTSTPWTLVGMVGLAIHPDAIYALVEVGGGEGAAPIRVLLAENSLEQSLQAPYSIVRKMPGKALTDGRYRPLFTFLPDSSASGQLVLTSSVPLDRGTGLMPVTPSFDQLSLKVAAQHGLSLPQLLDEWGSLDEPVTAWRGLSPLEAESLLIEDLQGRGLVFREEPIREFRPHCPYCSSLLTPLARQVWLVDGTTESWIVDRDRYWGTPLPIWACRDCDEKDCLAGPDDLAHRTGLPTEELDLHRPAVDRYSITCRSCGGTMTRVSPVVDTAFENVVASSGTSHPPEPADLAVGLGDPEAGWLHDLHSLSILLNDTSGWRQATSIPETRYDEAWTTVHSTPGDALRWAAYTGTTPQEAEEGFLRQVWHAAQRLLAEPLEQPPPRAQQMGAKVALLDHWILARLHQTIGRMTTAMEQGESSRAALELAGLVGDIDYWYLDLRPAGGVEILDSLTRLLAPFVPHLSEVLQEQRAGRGAASIHRAGWPEPDSTLCDESLLKQMDLVQRFRQLGASARTKTGIAAGVTLPRAELSLLPSGTAQEGDLAFFDGLLAEALCVAQVQVIPITQQRVAWKLQPRPDRVTRRSVAPTDLEAVMDSLEPAAAADMAAQLREGYSVSVEVLGQALTLLPDEVTVTVQAQSGWVAASDGRCLVVIETEAGTARR